MTTLEILITAVSSLAAWTAATRYLFRRWVRNDTIEWNGYPTGPSPYLACLAAITALFLPAIIPVLLFGRAVMSNPPVSRRELERKTRLLEAENTRLRREQDQAQET